MVKIQKHAVITGASSPIATTLAPILIHDGFSLSLIAHSPEKINDISAQLKKYKNQVTLYACDIGQKIQVHNTFSKILSEINHIQTLITLAGAGFGKKIEEDSLELFEKDVAVNLTGTYACIREAYEHMPQGGAIVTVASSRGRTGSPSSSVGYAAAKAGVINLTKSCALQLAKYGIRVNCVSPYYIHPSPFTAKYNEEQLTNIVQGVPLGKLCTYEDIANAIYFLISDKSSNITGHTLDVDGGIWMN